MSRQSADCRMIVAFFATGYLPRCFIFAVQHRHKIKLIGMKEIIQTLLTAVTVLGGWEAVRYLINRKTNRRVEEAKADSAEFAVLKETVDFLQQQLKDKEVRFAEQTGLVRELNSDVLRLTNEKAAVELELQKFKCVVPKCASRQPQNGY